MYEVVGLRFGIYVLAHVIITLDRLAPAIVTTPHGHQHIDNMNEHNASRKQGSNIPKAGLGYELLQPHELDQQAEHECYVNLQLRLREQEELDQQAQVMYEKQLDQLVEWEQRMELEYERQFDQHSEWQWEREEEEEQLYGWLLEQQRLEQQAECSQTAEEEWQLHLDVERDQRVQLEYERQLDQYLEHHQEQDQRAGRKYWQLLQQQYELDKQANQEHSELLQAIRELEEQKQLSEALQQQQFEKEDEENLRAMEQHEALIYSIGNDHYLARPATPLPPAPDPMRPDATCAICLHALANTVLIPCGHLIACAVLASHFPACVVFRN